MARSVRRPYERVKMNVVCQSSRAGSPVKLIVMHSTEGHNRPGISDLSDLGHFFDNEATQASSHVGVDNEGYSAQFVPDQNKAWAQAHYNSVALSIEMIGQAAQSKSAWLVNNRAQLKKCAKYLAYWSKKYNIPLQIGKVTVAGGVRTSGVVTHKMLGQLGGGHVDPGPNFPLDALLIAARYYKRMGWK